MEDNNSRTRYYHLVPHLAGVPVPESGSVSGRQPRAAGQTGLGNSGNSCYLNCVLQCLKHSGPLAEHFLSGAYSHHINRGRGELSNAFSALLVDMWLGDYMYVFPDEVKRVLGKVHPPFSDGSQQDAQELLLFFLNVLHADLKKSTGVRNVETSIVTRLFQGQLSYVKLCLNCYHNSNQTETFLSLSLPMPPDRICSIQDCFRLFFKEEVLSLRDRPYCSFCSQKQDQLECIQLLKAPDIIIIHLKRFESGDNGNRKLSSMVTFPLEDLDLTQYTTTPATQHPKYQLYAVVNHTGTLESGHYTAFCKNPLTQNWHEFNDAKVTSISEQKIQSPAAYILFYNCVNFQWSQ
ncbi:putative ubiquitin carboxyl-terminal hydrolase 50 isoform X2 [Hypanus sabinus]|uniref:putative ubiquitin carboxyl-terminal hydrolase 50 isoform X2 n=1 Tax=Hypanus sabinus TaxID=79690 RepID=UPI0028C38063|nr:putative ubiquitin carboxyl-terminal hydrolase 50 isoform X2 [Hypanus sabinus]